jgi:hypothetical protein
MAAMDENMIVHREMNSTKAMQRLLGRVGEGRRLDSTRALNRLVEDRETQKDTAAEIDGMLMKDMNEV